MATTRREAKGKLLRVSEDTHARVARLAEFLGASHREVVEQAIAALERKRFLDSVRSSYDELASDPEAMAAYRAEIALWDATAGDGLGPRSA